MIAKLWRLDPATRAIPACVAGAVAIAAIHALTYRVTLGKLEFIDGEELSAEHGNVAHFAVVVMIAVLALNGLRTRVSEHQLSLPVRPRTWVTARILALGSLGWLAFLASTVTGTAITDAAWGSALLEAFALMLAWTAWVVGNFAVEPELPRARSLPRLVGVHVVGGALLVTCLSAPVFGGAGALVALVIGVAALAKNLPDRMVLDVVRRARGRGRSESRMADDDRRHPLRVWIARRTVLRLPVLVFGVFMLLLVSVVWGVDTSLLVFAVLMPMWLAAMVSHAAQVLREVGHLPISRRRLAPWVLLPGLLALVFGVVGASGLRALDPSPTGREEVDVIAYDRDDPTRHQTVRVPGHLHRLVFGLAPVRVTAPSGESAVLEPKRLVPGLPLGALNPYGFGPGSSRAFVAWQLSRAVRDAYGYEVDAATIDESYLSVLDGRVIAPFFATRFREDHGEQALRWPRSFPFLGMFVALVFWGLSAWVALSPNVPPATERAWLRRKRFRAVAATILFVLLFGSLTTPFLVATGGRDHPDLRFVLASWIDSSPLGSPALLALALAVAAIGTYRLLERRFLRLEVPPELPKPWAQQRQHDVAPVETGAVRG